MKALVVAAGIVTVAAAFTAPALALDIKDLFGGGGRLQKFAVKAQEETTLQGKRDKSPYLSKKEIILQCDFTVSIECTNEFMPRSTSTLWIRRDAKVTDKPYTIIVGPQLIDGKHTFGPYAASELVKGVDITVDKSSPAEKRTLKMRLAVHEAT